MTAPGSTLIPPAEPDASQPGIAEVPPRTRHEGFTFSGTGGEYFRIWIVNILLTVLTLGIYSAWAKVRTMQYFYRNTRLAGASFDYHGDPVAILKGRLLAALLFGIYTVAGMVSPTAALAAFAMLVCALPWLLYRSLRFRCYNTSYRGLRLRFTGTTADAYRVFLLLPISVALTLGGLFPLWQHRMKRYLHSNTSYGHTPFSFDATAASFYRVYLTALGLGVALIAGAAVVVGVFVAGALSFGGTPAGTVSTVLGVSAGVIMYVSGSMAIWAFISARVQNLAWNGTHVGPHRFVSAIKARQLAFITVTNLLGLLVTLGLFKPLAEVRLNNYLLSASTVAVSGSLDDFVAAEQAEISAVGEEAVDMFDFDIAI